MAQEMYPETTLLKEVKGVGDLMATAYVLTIEDPHRFRRRGMFRRVAAWRRNSGESEPGVSARPESLLSCYPPEIFSTGPDQRNVDSISQIFLRAKHWQIFFLLLGTYVLSVIATTRLSPELKPG